MTLEWEVGRTSEMPGNLFYARLQKRTRTFCSAEFLVGLVSHPLPRDKITAIDSESANPLDIIFPGTCKS